MTTINSDNFDLVENVNAGGAFSITPLPSDEELEKYYESQYWQVPDRPHTQFYDQQELDYLSLNHDLLLSMIPISNYKALDIGAGEGFFLKKLLDEGIEAVGLDFNDYAISKFNPSIAQHLIKGDILNSIDSIIYSGAKYEVIFVNHFLEHITRPELFLLKLKDILTSPGYVMISVPNDFSELQRELKIKGHYSKDYFVKFPDHLHYFNAKSLKNLLNDLGFRFIDGIADFPIEWFIANPHSNYAVGKSLGKGAHNARIFLETLINQKDKMLALQFWRSLFELGQGRSITAVFEFQGNK